MIYGIYDTIRLDKLQLLIKFALQNNNDFFILHLLNITNTRSLTIYNKLYEWLFQLIIQVDKLSLFTYLIEHTSPSKWSYLFSTYPISKYSIACFTHPLLSCIRHNSYKCLYYILNQDLRSFNINVMFQKSIQLSCLYHQLQSILYLLYYYDMHEHELHTSIHDIKSNYLHHDNLYHELIHIVLLHKHISIFDFILSQELDPNYIFLRYIHLLFQEHNTLYHDFIESIFNISDMPDWVIDSLFSKMCFFDHIISIQWCDIMYTHHFSNHIHTIYLKTIQYDSIDTFNYLLAYKYNSSDTYHNTFISCALQYNSYHIFNLMIHIWNVDTAHFRIDDTEYDLLDYALFYNSNDCALVLLQKQNRPQYKLNIQYLSFYKQSTVITHLLPSEIIHLIQKTKGSFYFNLDDEHKELYHSTYIKSLQNVIERETQDICLITRELPIHYILCINKIRPHVISLESSTKLNPKMCPLCRLKLNENQVYINTIQQ